MDYSIEYFINKFENIPEQNWRTGWYWGYTSNPGYEKAYCALGHCGATAGKETQESNALRNIFQSKQLGVFSINDGSNTQFQQTTPKQRILEALKWISL